MSLGGNSSKQNTQSQASSYLDPTQTGIVDQYAQSVQQAATNPNSPLAYHPYTGPGLSFGDPSSLQALTSYQAPKATATGYTAANVDPSTVGNVTAGQIASTDLNPYLNPYTSDVINTTTGQLARQNNIDNTTAAGNATSAGAFGGSRSAVLQNLNTDSYQRNLDQTVANLNSANFNQAQGAAGQDIASKLAADTTNLGKNLSVAQGNQTATNQGLQFGAQSQNTASLANQQADEAAATQRLQAVGLSTQQAQAVFGANWQQYVNSQTTPEQLQQLVTQAMGLIPTNPLTQSTSSGSGGSAGFNFGLPLPS